MKHDSIYMTISMQNSTNVLSDRKKVLIAYLLTVWDLGTSFTGMVMRNSVHKPSTWVVLPC